MSKEEIINSLIGYPKGTYGGTMKGLMKGQIVRLKEADFKKIA